MTGYSLGDVVLVPFPFTDQSAAKRRPAVVVSSSALHAQGRDLIIMAVTTQLRPDSTLEVDIVQWQQAGLLAPSVVKPVMASIERILVVKRLGKLTSGDAEKLRQAIGRIVG